MEGVDIALRTISRGTRKGKAAKPVQYHPRSDHHSKVVCCCILFDLLTHCKLLREHAAAGRVGIGINHEMVDFRQNRKKNLDLVIGLPDEARPGESDSMSHLVNRFGLLLNRDQKAMLAEMPALHRGRVGTVLVALEAKACMTEHQKARPRLYDELSSSALTVNGDTNSAIAACHVLINAATEFRSPTRGNETNVHAQPKAARVVLEKVSELHRRSSESGTGFDAVGITLIDCRNDGSAIVEVDALSDGTSVPTALTYSEMVRRLATTYAARWRNI